MGANATTPTVNRAWYGYIDRTQFPNLTPGGSADTTDAWTVNYANAPAIPTRGFISSTADGAGSNPAATGGSSTTLTAANVATNLDTALTAALDYYVTQANATNAAGNLIQRSGDAELTIQSSGTWTGSNPASGTDFRLFPLAGTGAVLAVTAAMTGGFLPASNYTFGSTFVYDGLQESPMFKLLNGFGTASGVYTLTGEDIASLTGSIHLTSPYDPRITGMRIYCQYDQDAEDNWYLLWDVDFAKGSRTHLAEDIWQEDTAGTPFTIDELNTSGETFVIHTLPTAKRLDITYWGINGYHPDEDLDIRYKTSALVNGMLYVGNCYKTIKGTAALYPDRIWRCAFSTYAGRPAIDTFPEGHFNENTAAAGDTIVKLMAFGNRLLSFGKNYLTVWDVGLNADLSVVHTFARRGVAHPAHVVETPKGICFINNSGVFIFNGESTIDLTLKRGSESSLKRVVDWDTFFSESSVPVIGYDGVDDTLVILKGADYSVDPSKDILVHDFATMAWTYGDTKFSVVNKDHTNFITAPNSGELVAAAIDSSAGYHLKRFKAHQAASISSSTVDIRTPFYDFGSSGLKKRLYKVRVTCYGTNLDDLRITASYDGDNRSDASGYTNRFSSNTFANSEEGTDDYDTQTFTVSSPEDFTNVSLRIYSHAAMTIAKWAISEITFIYRAKGVR